MRFYYVLKGVGSVAEANDSSINEYITHDGLVFKTLLDIGHVQTKEYDLEILEKAEGRVQRGTNKTLQAALNSLKSLKQSNKKSANGDEFDEFGLNDEYTNNQKKFIRDTIQGYYDAHDISTPYQKSGVIRLSKLECTITELEVNVTKNKKKEDIESLQKLQAMHKSLSDALKLQTKQATDGDKSEDILANACIDYEARFSNDEFHFEDIEEKERLLELITVNADNVLQDIRESANYFAFKKRLVQKLDGKVSSVDNVGKITIEELFDCYRLWEDRKMIQSKIDSTIDTNFIDRGDEEL